MLRAISECYPVGYCLRLICLGYVETIICGTITELGKRIRRMSFRTSCENRDFRAGTYQAARDSKTKPRSATRDDRVLSCKRIVFLH